MSMLMAVLCNLCQVLTPGSVGSRRRRHSAMTEQLEGNTALELQVL